MMRAEREDAPARVQRRQSNIGRWLFTAALVIGSVSAWVFMLKHGQPIVINLDELRRAIQLGDEPAPWLEQQTSATQHAPREWQAPPPMQFPKHREHEAPEPTYRPAAPQALPAPSQSQPQQQPKQNARVLKRDTWEWQLPFEKINGEMTWVVVNGKVDTSSICKNETLGRVRHEDCRKGAVATFARRCSLLNERSSCDAVEQHKLRQWW